MKNVFFFEKNAVGHMTFVGWLTLLAGQTVHTSFMIELSYFAPIISLYLLLIIYSNFLIKFKIFDAIDCIHINSIL